MPLNLRILRASCEPAPFSFLLLVVVFIHPLAVLPFDLGLRFLKLQSGGSVRVELRSRRARAGNTNFQPAREVHAHKGLEDVEGVDDEVPNLREWELERRQREEEEKRERELLYLCRRSRELGGPPRVPIHTLTPTEEVFGGQKMSLEPR
ncbi:hypothetical protein C8F04DRAFT_1266710 [Mycena alexandri]|uniref:Uncharacterized protein n=1 Tax=Mycena alexandri TaxID=1745969 RepID=A0AAD6SIQ4_9AGAR|nr:hypothetical protein C8F04DRAFT_1266710 [Mycena alexandri]